MRIKSRCWGEWFYVGGYRLYAWQIFRESLNIRSRKRHNASTMVVWAPLLFSQCAGSRLSCSLVRWASRLWAVEKIIYWFKQCFANIFKLPEPLHILFYRNSLQIVSLRFYVVDQHKEVYYPSFEHLMEHSTPIICRSKENDAITNM